MADPQSVIHTAKGLYSQHNRLECPPGALLQADNAVIDRPGVIEKRRGFVRYASATAGSTLLKFNKTLLVLDGTTLKADNGSGTLSAFSGSYAPPTGLRMEGVEAGQCFFFTTSAGVYVLDSLTGTPRLAGVPPGLDVQLAASGATGFQPTDSQVSYRILWGRTNSHGQELIGEPSQAEISVNASGVSIDIIVTSTIPTGIIAGDFYEIYRTEHSSADHVEPGDRHRLVIRNIVTSAEITAGHIHYTDIMTDDDLGADLYSNPMLETSSKLNNPPPYAEHIALFKGHLWFLNTRSFHRQEIRLLTVTGITDNTDSITVTSGATVLTYTFSTAENIGALKFKRYTVADGTDVRTTMKSFCHVVNNDTTNTLFWARYISGADDNPGIVEIRRRDLSDTAFTLTATSGCSTKFTPTIPTTGVTLASTCDSKKNGLYHSKYEKPEAVPQSNYDPIGSENYKGQGLVSLKDSLIVLKEDGYFQVTGTSDGMSGSTFIINQLDPTIRTIAPGTIVCLDNSVYAHTTQQIIRATESGSKIMSWPIEVDMLRIAQIANYSTIAHAIPYESDRKYLLCTPEYSGDTKCQIIWVYNYITECWTKWPLHVSSGIVIEQSTGGDKLYLALNDQPYIVVERKSFLASDEDFCDETLNVSVTATTTTAGITTVTVTYTDIPLLCEGMIFKQGDREAIVDTVSFVSGSSYHLTLDRAITVTVAAATVSLPISMAITWMPEAAGSVSVMKQFSEGQIYFERANGTHQMGFCADTQLMPEFTSDITIPKSYGWGFVPWGDTPWGDAYLIQSSPIRSWVPRNHQRARAMRLLYTNRIAKEKISILQVAYVLRPYSDRTTRNP